jgi:hypothetical protein
MTDSQDSVRPTFAVLKADGTIEVELVVPGYDETQEMTIESTKAALAVATIEDRIIDLDGGDFVDARVRTIIAERIRLIQREIERQRAVQERRHQQRTRAGAR